MRKQHWIGIGLIVFLLAGPATPGLAVDRFDRIWLRDTVVGGGLGLGLGLVSRDTTGWLLLGLIAGGVFGYLDAKNHLIADATEPPSPWAPSARIVVEARSIDGREQPEHMLKATLYRAAW